jgi:hypothetical protein
LQDSTLEHYSENPEKSGAGRRTEDKDPEEAEADGVDHDGNEYALRPEQEEDDAAGRLFSSALGN